MPELHLAADHQDSERGAGTDRRGLRKREDQPLVDPIGNGAGEGSGEQGRHGVAGGDGAQGFGGAGDVESQEAVEDELHGNCH